MPKCARTCAGAIPGTTGRRIRPSPNRPAAPNPPAEENPGPDGLPPRIAACDYGFAGRRIAGWHGLARGGGAADGATAAGTHAVAWQGRGQPPARGDARQSVAR